MFEKLKKKYNDAIEAKPERECITIAKSIVHEAFRLNQHYVDSYLEDCRAKNLLLEYDEYLNRAWGAVFATSMQKAKKTKFEGLKPGFAAKNLDRIEDKLLTQEHKQKINMHKPSFAAYAISNAIDGNRPTPRETRDKIMPLDDEIKLLFDEARKQLVSEGLRDEYGLD